MPGTATATKTAAPNQKARAAAQPTRPFRAGTQSMEDLQYDQTLAALTAGTRDMPDFLLNGDGFLRGVYLHFVATTSANAATVAFSQNGPWNVIDTVHFLDTAQRDVVGPFDGFTLFVVNKFGGYFNQNDPRADLNYSAITGAGSTGGSFEFVLYIPLEITGRDGLGSLVNKNTAVPFRVKIRLAAGSTVYSTAPTTLPSVRIRGTQDNWWEPAATDAKGHPLSAKPPAPNTTQFWAYTTYPLNSGANGSGQQLAMGLGYPIRSYHFIVMDTSNSRSAGDGFWPDPFTLTIEKNTLFVRQKNLWISRLSRAYDLLSTTPDTARGRENGVFSIWAFMNDFSAQPGVELRNGYLATRGGQNFLASGNFGGAVNLGTLVNWVAPANGDPASLTMSRS